jgi:hypothetical protein
MNSTKIDSYLSPLLGHGLLSVERKDYSWFFSFASDISIATESAWRLIRESHIVTTSEDHGHQFGLPAPVDAAMVVMTNTANCVVEKATLSAFPGDLIIEFSGQTCLHLLQMSAGYESWRIVANGAETICTGGGALEHFARR